MTPCEPAAKGEGVKEAGEPVFRVISVAPPVRFEVVHETDPPQEDPPALIVQPVAESVPEELGALSTTTMAESVASVAPTLEQVISNM